MSSAFFGQVRAWFSGLFGRQLPPPQDPGRLGIDTPLLRFSAKWEGLYLQAYDDGFGTWTIGYGHTEGVRQGDTCTRAQAEAWLRADLADARAGVLAATRRQLSQNQLDALTDFAFNLGVGAYQKSHLRLAVEANDDAAVCAQLLLWDHAGGVRVQGLTNRRQAEGDLYTRKGPTP